VQKMTVFGGILSKTGKDGLTIDTLSDALTGGNGINSLTITNSNANALDTINTLTLGSSGTISSSFTLTLTGNVGLGTGITTNNNGVSTLNGPTINDNGGFTLAALQDNANIYFTLNDSAANNSISNTIQVGTGTNVIVLNDTNTSTTNKVSDTITFADNSTVFNGGSTPTHLTAVALGSLTGSAPSTTDTVAFDFSYVPTSTTFSFDTTPITITQTDTSLAAALADAQSHLPTAYNGGFFTWGGNAYFFADSTTGHQAVIELVGVTGTNISSITVAQANHQVVVS